jgi:hypothetical protein
MPGQNFDDISVKNETQNWSKSEEIRIFKKSICKTIDARIEISVPHPAYFEVPGVYVGCGMWDVGCAGMCDV